MLKWSVCALGCSIEGQLLSLPDPAWGFGVIYCGFLNARTFGVREHFGVLVDKTPDNRRRPQGRLFRCKGLIVGGVLTDE